MALTQSHVSDPSPHAPDTRLSPQEEQIVRMRNGEQLAAHEELELASGDNLALRDQLLALEAQLLARAPEPRRTARLRLVPNH